MSKLFSALRIGQLELSHRLVTTMRARSELDAAGYIERSTAGGLIIAEAYSSRGGDPARWERINGAIHTGGGLTVALVGVGSQHPRADHVDVDSVIDDIQGAARRARATGFDGVELDAAVGSLAERFLQPITNARDDEYGGDEERRMRFLLEAAHVLAEEFSSERVGVRLSPGAREGQAKVLAGVMRATSELEMAYVHLAHVDAVPAPLQGGPSPMAACIERQAFRSDVSCALIVSDHCEVEVAARAVESRWADAVGFLQVNDDPSFIARLLRRERESGRLQ